MKVLLVNPAHPQTFWSFETVIKMLGKKALLPPLGLLTVAALLPRDWDLKLVDLTFQEISPKDWDECDIVMVSGMIVQYQGILQTIQEGKRRAKTVVVGGAWAFHYPEDALAAGADLVVKGEGEVALPLLLKSLERKESGKVIRAAGAARMDDSPAPRYDLIDPDNYMNLALQFSRGCPFRCEFCDITLMLGRRVRTKTPRQFLEELQLLYDTGWRGPIFVVDDNFIGNPGRAKVLLKELVPWQSSRGHPFEFYTQASVNLAWDQELLELMVRAGFTSVFLGIETTDEESLRLAGKTQNVGVDLDLVCQTINRAGLVIQAGCILGFDQERPGADRRLLDFAFRNQIPEMFITLLQAGPGTELWMRLEKEGRLLFSDYQHFSNQTGLINFVPTRPLAQIVEEFIHLYQVLYEPGYYLERALAHFSSMGPLRVTKPFSWPRLFEVRAVLLFLFRQGIRSPWRWKFWKTLLTALWRIPERLHHFISVCIKLEHYFQYRQTIAAELRGQLARLDQDRVFPGKVS
jgi:radical SAM superfamily enzyme YgiQ (UPF0313 family)